VPAAHYHKDQAVLIKKIISQTFEAYVIAITGRSAMQNVPNQHKIYSSPCRTW
jgi:hypothetical protein